MTAAAVVAQRVAEIRCSVSFTLQVGSPWQGFLVAVMCFLHPILAWGLFFSLFLSPHLSRSLDDATP